MTIFFETLKENNSVAKTLVILLQNKGDYDISEKDIESAMKHIRLSDLLALNDAVEERNMGIVIDILEPFIPGILPQTNEIGSPTARMTGNNTGNKEKQYRPTAFTQPTGTVPVATGTVPVGCVNAVGLYCFSLLPVLFPVILAVGEPISFVCGSIPGINGSNISITIPIFLSSTASFNANKSLNRICFIADSISFSEIS